MEPAPVKRLPLLRQQDEQEPSCTKFPCFIKKDKETKLLIRDKPFISFFVFLASPNYFFIGLR